VLAGSLWTRFGDVSSLTSSITLDATQHLNSDDDDDAA